jgi:hypothetical protein
VNVFIALFVTLGSTWHLLVPFMTCYDMDKHNKDDPPNVLLVLTNIRISYFIAHLTKYLLEWPGIA